MIVFFSSKPAHVSNLTTVVTNPETNKILETNQNLTEVLEKIGQSTQPDHGKLAAVPDRILAKEDDETEIKSRSQLPKLNIKKFFGNIPQNRP